MAARAGKVHVATTRRHYKGKVYETHLLRRTYREGGTVKNETVGNLSHLPLETIGLIRRSLAGEHFLAGRDLEIQRSRPHGHVLAVTGLMRQLGIAALLDRTASRERDLACALIAARVCAPGSKLATQRSWHASTLSDVFGVGDATVDEVYAACDWLRARQPRIERGLARRHLSPDGLVLYDLSSSYVEGRRCPLAKRGYSRDGKRGTLQIEYGLVTDDAGRPVAVEVFAGNTGDPKTVPTQVTKLQTRFGLAQVVLVGDRGMLTAPQLDGLRAAKLAWITALRAPQIQALVADGTLQLGLFDERNLAELTHPAYPGERLVVCRNPLLAQERARKREDLLRATEALLAPLEAAVAAGRLRGAAAIGLKVGRVLHKHKMAKHFTVDIGDDRLGVQRQPDAIAAEAALDGLYVLRTSLAPGRLAPDAVVRVYKSLSRVERAFRTWKGLDLQVRPIYHWSADRVRAHVLLCLLAYYVRWHLERAWAPLLFRDEARPEPADPVAPAQRSAAAQRKASTQQLDDGTPVHSFRTLLADLTTIARNRVVPRGLPAAAAFDCVTTPTPLQARALALLDVSVTGP
ncbi:MAG: IS1634 family transposase [Candidatus Dormibacteraceae bacterium]